MLTTNQEILDACKEQIRIHIEMLLEKGERVANIEIELFHHMKKILYKD